MITKIKQLFHRGPEWWEEDFLLGNPYSERQWQAITTPPLTLAGIWDQKEVEKRKQELRLRRDVEPVELPSIPRESLDESLEVKDWYNLFDNLGLL